MKTEIIIGFSRYGDPLWEDAVVIKTADPSITGRIFEVEGKYYVREHEDDTSPKRFNKLSEAVNYCQPRVTSWGSVG